MKRIKKSSFWVGDRYSCAGCRKGAEYLDHFCGHCGSAIEWETCPYCWRIIELMEGNFCQYCGKAPIRR